MTSSGNTVNYYFHLRKQVYEIIGQGIYKLQSRFVSACHQFNNPLETFQGLSFVCLLGFLFLNRQRFSIFLFFVSFFLACLLNSGVLQLLIHRMLPYVENSLLLLSQFLYQSVPPKIKTLKFVYLVDKTMQSCIQILSLNLLGIVIIIKKKG